MKVGKQSIYDLPISDIMTLGTLAAQLQQEAKARGEVFPPSVRLHIGEPNFAPPEHIRQAAITAIEQEPMTYGPVAGWPWLRELLAEKVKRVNGYTVGPEHTAIALGGTGAVLSALLATVGVGDEVLLPNPGWPLYYAQLAVCGAKPVPYPLDPQNGWLPTIDALERLVNSRTRLLILNSPGNPTGTIFPARLVADLVEFAHWHDLYLLSDECYDEMIFEGKHTSPATLLARNEFELGRVISVYSFSKTYAMTGWRIGYVVAGKQLMKTITDVLNASYSNISTLTQRAAAAALTGPQDCVAEMREVYRRRRDLVITLLKELGRYNYTPQGAFYALINVTSPSGVERRGRQFSLDLLRQRNVSVAPGSGFGSAAEPYVRISLSASDEEIERGIREICAFANNYP